MATRQQVEERRTEMISYLRSVCDRQSAVGGSLPPLRQLADQFQVSLSVAQSVMRTLQDEGLVSAVRGAGTSVITRSFATDEIFLFLRSPGEGTDTEFGSDATIIGFTDRLGELGAFSLAVPSQEVLLSIVSGSILRVKGLYGNIVQNGKFPIHELRFPTVAFGEHADPKRDDTVRWDDMEGGRIATQHLLSLGHRKILFVGKGGDGDFWAAQRADGYRQAMREAGWQHLAEVFGPEQGNYRFEEQLVQLGTEAARLCAARSMPDAVVACNDAAATAFLRELDVLKVPLIRWPAIIGFDDRGHFGGQPISSMRMDTRELGRSAADLLWKRAHGQLEGPPVTVALPLRLVPRMTSQEGWAYRLHRLIDGFPFGSAAHDASGSQRESSKNGDIGPGEPPF